MNTNNAIQTICKEAAAFNAMIATTAKDWGLRDDETDGDPCECSDAHHGQMCHSGTTLVKQALNGVCGFLNGFGVASEPVSA